MEVDANNTAARTNAIRAQQQQQQQQVQQSGNATGTRSGQGTGQATGDQDVASGTRAREVTVAQASATNDERGTAGRALLGAGGVDDRLGMRTADPAMPNTQGGDPNSIYQDAGAGSASLDAAANVMSMRGPGATTLARRANRAPGTGSEQGDGPEQPDNAGAAVSNAQDPRGAAQNLADRAGLGPLPGVPMSRANENRRAAEIRDSLLRGEDPRRAQGRQVQVTPEERRILNGNDQEARRRTAEQIGRREAQRDSLVQAAGNPQAAARLEQAYAQSTPEQRAQDAPQIDREENARRMAAAGETAAWALGPTALARIAASGFGRGVAALYNRLNRAGGSPLPNIPLGRGPAGARTNGTPRQRQSGADRPDAPRPRRQRTEEQRLRDNEMQRLRRQRARETPRTPES